MIGGIVEIADAGRHVSVHREFVRVSEGGDEIGCVPLDDVTALIHCLARLAQSVATSLAKKSDALVLPEFKLADQLA